MHQHHLAISLAAALLALPWHITGCASTTTANSDATATQPQATPDFTDEFEALRTIGFGLDWRGYAILQAGATIRTLTPFDSAIIAQDSRNVITALEPDTGRIRWADAVPNELDDYRGHFLIDNQLISVTQSDISFRDIRNGTLQDRHRLSVLANTDAVLIDSMIIYGSTRGEAVGHSIQTGFKAWGNSLSGTIRRRPAITPDKRVVVVSDNGEVLIIDPLTGLAGQRRNRVFEGLDSNPVADNQRIYLASRDRSIWAFNLIEAEQVWRYRTESPLRAQPVLHAGVLYLHIPDEGFTALNSANGARLWRNPNLRGTLIGERRGRLLIWNAEDQTLSAVLPTNGSVVASHKFDGARLLSAHGFSEPTLYLVYGDGAIERFIPR